MTRRNFEPPRAVLCGSYKRDREGLWRAYDELVTTGCQVLSPRRMWFDDAAFVRDTAEQDIPPQAVETWQKNVQFFHAQHRKTLPYAGW